MGAALPIVGTVFSAAGSMVGGGGGTTYQPDMNKRKLYDQMMLDTAKRNAEMQKALVTQETQVADKFAKYYYDNQIIQNQFEQEANRLDLRNQYQNALYTQLVNEEQLSRKFADTRLLSALSQNAMKGDYTLTDSKINLNALQQRSDFLSTQMGTQLDINSTVNNIKATDLEHQAQEVGLKLSNTQSDISKSQEQGAVYDAYTEKMLGLAQNMSKTQEEYASLVSKMQASGLIQGAQLASVQNQAISGDNTTKQQEMLRLGLSTGLSNAVIKDKLNQVSTALQGVGLDINQFNKQSQNMTDLQKLELLYKYYNPIMKEALPNYNTNISKSENEQQLKTNLAKQAISDSTASYDREVARDMGWNGVISALMNAGNYSNAISANAQKEVEAAGAAYKSSLALNQSNLSTALQSIGANTYGVLNSTYGGSWTEGGGSGASGVLSGIAQLIGGFGSLGGGSSSSVPNISGALMPAQVNPPSYIAPKK